MGITEIIALITQVGWPLGKKLIDLWASKKDAIVTPEEWTTLSQTLNKTYDDYLNDLPPPVIPV